MPNILTVSSSALLLQIPTPPLHITGSLIIPSGIIVSLYSHSVTWLWHVFLHSIRFQICIQRALFAVSSQTPHSTFCFNLWFFLHSGHLLSLLLHFLYDTTLMSLLSSCLRKTKTSNYSAHDTGSSVRWGNAVWCMLGADQLSPPPLPSHSAIRQLILILLCTPPILTFHCRINTSIMKKFPQIWMMMLNLMLTLWLGLS